MKTKCSFILKSAVALVLTFLMLFGSISSVIAATVDVADSSANDADLASTGADTWKVTWKANMGSSDYNTGTTYYTMTQSSKDSNKYYYTATLSANTNYGFFLQKNSSNYYKANATATADADVQLYDYGNSNYGNSNHRVTFKTGSATKYAFTFDTSNNKVTVSPYNPGVQFTYDVASGHDSNYDLDKKVTMSTSSDYIYTCDVDMSAVKYYLFAKVGSRYYRAATKLETSTPRTVYDYGSSNYGNSGDKINFTPGSAGKYRFTYDNRDKTISVAKVTYNVKKSESGTTGGTVKLGTTTLTTSNQAMNPGSYALSITAPSGYNVSAVSVSGGSLTTAGTTGSNTYSGTVNVTADTTVSVTYVAATTPSIKTFTISNSTLNIGETATLSSTTENTTKSVTYSTTSDAISISGSTVTAIKPVSSATITATLVDGSTYTKTVTVKVNTPTVSFSSATQATIVVNDTVKRTATGSTVGSAATTKTVTYSGTNEYINVASDGTVTGLKPTTSAQTVTATYTVKVDSVTTTATATYKVAVSKPTLKAMSAKTVYIGDTVQSDTPSITANAPASGTVTYTYTSGTTANATINSSGLITGVKAGTSTITVTAKLGDITLNTTTFTVTVKDRDTVYMNAYTKSGTNVLESAGNTMTYDKQLGLYKYTTTALSKSTTYYINIWDATAQKNYRPDTKVTKSYPITGDGLGYTQDSNSTEMTTSAMTGSYTFYYNYTTHKFYVDYPAAYTVTLNAHGGTGAQASVGYEGLDIDLTAAAYTPTKDGYKFLGWYTAETGGTKVTKVSGLTGNVTYHAQWEKAYTVTVSKTTGGSISPTTESYLVGSTAVTLPTATASAGYDFTGWTTTGGVVMSDTDKAKASGATMTATAAGTVTANFKAKPTFTLKAVSNKSSRGTVTVNPTSAYVGQTVTITVTEKSGTLSALSYSYASGTTYNYNFTSKKFVKATATTGAAAKSDLAATGASVDAAPTGETTTYTFKLEEAANVTVNATFNAYAGESEYYYTGYSTSSGDSKNRPTVSGYVNKQLTEGLVNGKKYAYIEINRGTEDNQIFQIKNAPDTTGKYVYFQRPNMNTDGGNSGWYSDKLPYAYFMGVGDEWPGTQMKWVEDDTYGKNFRIAVPRGATGVIFNDYDGSKVQTPDITDLESSGWYLTGETYKNGDTTIAKVTKTTAYGNNDSVKAATIYDYNSNSVYTNKSDFGSTVTFGDWDQYYANPNATGTYYVVVYYPNTDYGTIGNNKSDYPKVVVTTELPGEANENVRVYAKDGAIVGYGQTYADLADTVINDASGSHVGKSSADSGQTYETYSAEKGTTITIKTTILEAYRTKYYVRGFCVNGEVPKGTLNTKGVTTDGVYELTYKIDDEYDGQYIEITPIYYLADTEANPVVTFRVQGFTDDLKEVGTGKPNWGDTLYAYPFYEQLGSYNNAFGNYPGQPLVYYNGQYQIQIPVNSTAWAYDNEAKNTKGASSLADVNKKIVSGVTMSNGYYDSVHRTIMGYGDNDGTKHVQTYDYDDFYKIYNEVDQVDNIVFEFKYKTTNDNRQDANGNKGTAPVASFTKDTLSSTFTNGFEPLKNYHGRVVDLFGTPLSGDQLDAIPVYVVSTAGPSADHTTTVANIAGYYATTWAVYGSSNGTNYSRIKDDSGNANIPPSVLIISKADDINDTTYPSASTDKISNYKALYQKLEAYRGKPVMITYEKAKGQKGENDASADISGGATRNDGRWLYSKNGESITSTIKIKYAEDGINYVDLDTENPQVSGLEAYFTNTEAYGKQTYATTIDPDKNFTFEAKTTNGNYRFMGWYLDDSVKITSDNEGFTERSGSYTIVAKFMKVTSGQLILSHSVGTDDTYKGSGTAKIAVTVTDPDNGNEVIKSFDATTSDITLDSKYISSDKNYNITVTLTATASNNSALGTTSLVKPNANVTDALFFSGLSSYDTSTDAATKTRTDTFTFSVKNDLYNGTNQRTTSLIYHSYFRQYVFNYNINFEYYDRFDTSGGTSATQKKVYNKQGTLTNAQAEAYVYKQDVTIGSKTESRRFLRKDFVQSIAPYESNFNENLTWDFSTELDFGGEASGSNYVYHTTGHYVAIQKDVDARTVTFSLPYAHTNGVPADTETVAKADSTNLALTVKYGEIVKNSANEYVTAPKQVGDKYFQYWSIKTTDADGAEVARCYYNDFNFIAYDNYYIVPVYDAAEYDYHNSGTFTNITYLDTTRNQWNTDGENHAKTERTAAADLLYNDFMLNYNYNGLDIFLNGEDVAGVTDLGYIVERVQQLDSKQDGTLDTTLSKYAGKGLTADEAKAIVSGYNTNKGTQNKITKYSGTDSRIARYSVDKTALDNKNRIEIYDAYYNAAGWDKEDQDFVANYAYKNYVYKVYTYMVVDGETLVSDPPAYFTMYDEAVKTANDMKAN